MLTEQIVKQDPTPDKNYEIEFTNSGREVYEIDPTKILVQILHRPQESLHAKLVDASYGWISDGVSISRLQDPFGGWVNVTRNWQTKMFLQKQQYDWLVMIDADVGVPWYAPYQLVRHNHPVCSAIVPSFTQAKGTFACVAIKDEKGVARFPTLHGTKTLPSEGTVEVHNAGTGCLAVRRDVLETLWDRYEQDNSFGQPFELPIEEQRKAGVSGTMTRGEDICFTDRCHEAGFTVHADFSVRCYHEKVFQIEWPDANVRKIDIDEWKISALDYKVRQP